ncbi:hypothetical protein HII31_03205 [Pseudocercospora fuligena]|uniref:Uncharacterized protein n=1 Tax=Pseudocercospora fuligena TaxID=685502 RepID=A0A8H6VK15_9PEZI|nr:hypothetical protein HII31_03205 [Pseudocercospora fuligena]
MVSGTKDMPTWYIKCLPIFVFCTGAKWDMNSAVIETILESAQNHLTPSFQEVDKHPARHEDDCACVDCAKQRADLATWASVPLHDIGTFFKLTMDFLHGELSCTPHNHVSLESESLSIVPDLCRLNELGLMTTMSSPFLTHYWFSRQDDSFRADTQRPWLEFMVPQGPGLPTRAKIDKYGTKILAAVIFPRYEEGLKPEKVEGSVWGGMLAYASHTCEHRSSLGGPHPTGRRTSAPDRASLVKGTAEWEEIGKIACSRPASIWVAEQMSKGFAEHYQPIFFYMIARYWEDESNLYFYDNIRKLAIDAGFKILFPDPSLPAGEEDKPQKPQKTSRSRKTTIGRVTKPEQTKRTFSFESSLNTHSSRQICYTSSVPSKGAAEFSIAPDSSWNNPLVRALWSYIDKEAGKSQEICSIASILRGNGQAPGHVVMLGLRSTMHLFSDELQRSLRNCMHLLQTLILAHRQYYQHKHTEHCTPQSDTILSANMAFRALRQTLPAIGGAASTAAGIGWYLSKTPSTGPSALDTPLSHTSTIGSTFEEAAPLAMATASPLDVCWASSANANVNASISVSVNDNVCPLPFDSYITLNPPTTSNAIQTALATFLLLALLEIAFYYAFILGQRIERYVSRNVPYSVRSILSVAYQTYYRLAGIGEIALLALNFFGAVNTSKLPMWLHFLIVAGAILYGLWDFETEPLPDTLDLQAQNSELRMRIEKLKQRNVRNVSSSAKLTHTLKATSQTKLVSLKREHQKEMSAIEKQHKKTLTRVHIGHHNPSESSGFAVVTSDTITPLTSSGGNSISQLQGASQSVQSTADPSSSDTVTAAGSSIVRPPPVPYRESKDEWNMNLCKSGENCIGRWSDYDPKKGKYIVNNNNSQRWGSGYKPVEGKLAGRAKSMELCCDCFKQLHPEIIQEYVQKFLDKEANKTEEDKAKDVAKQAHKNERKRAANAAKAEKKVAAAAAAEEAAEEDN